MVVDDGRFEDLGDRPVVAGVAGPPLLLLLAAYIASSLAYCVWLKHEPLIDLAIIAGGFIMRTVAAGVAAGGIRRRRGRVAAQRRCYCVGH